VIAAATHSATSERPSKKTISLSEKGVAFPRARLTLLHKKYSQKQYRKMPTLIEEDHLRFESGGESRQENRERKNKKKHLKSDPG